MPRTTTTAALLVLVSLPLTAACSREPPPAPRQSLGNVMAEVARRFELAGKAANANRFELAEFEAGEIEELFESDVPNAELPKEGPTAHIPATAKAFLETNAPDLKKAAAAHDEAAFAAAFQRTSAACNGCHKASDKAFIEVPSVPGMSVPRVDPVGVPLPPAPVPASPPASASAPARSH
ncbi:MAG TPA: hypothetical protein VGG39_05705 [Polyangiaceae bacterium]|jgi:hypothetical protein